jgi:NAD(P)-dependent dehydrogenase (short-subunit alcohol dehydrogenase family)
MDLFEQLFSVKGKSVVVTGGAGGMGACAAESFCSLGAEVILVDINETALAAQLQKMKGLGGNGPGRSV